MVTHVLGQLRIDIGEEDAVVEFEGNRELGAGNEAIGEVPWPGDELRELVRFDERGRYRPLSGAKTLPGGWRVRCRAGEVEEVVEKVYPLATVHTRDLERGELRVVSLEDVLARQSGRYAVAATLDNEGRQLVRAVLCGDCVRSPVWAGDVPDLDEIPCPEPCSVFVSLCREAALWQKDRPETSTVDENVPYAAFDRKGNALREAYIAQMA